MTSRFYRTEHLSLAEKRALCERARELCFTWWADKLDCSESWCRQKVGMSWDEILAKLTNRSHFSVIHRQLEPENHLEVGFRSMDPASRVDYFLWINVAPEHIPELTAGLETME